MPPLDNPNDRYASAQRQMALFIIMALGVVLVMQFTMPKRPAPQPIPLEQQEENRGQEEVVVEGTEEPGDAKPDDAKPDEAKQETPEIGTTDQATDQVTTNQAIDRPVTDHPATYVTLGSLDSRSPYRMLVTVSSRGAAVTRVELNNPNYRDVQDRTGWMGQIVAELTSDMPENGCPVQVVGIGTPAEKAGLEPGDLITKFDDSKIGSFDDLREQLLQTRPRRNHKLTVQRGDKELVLDITLGQAPLAVIRPEISLHTYDDYTFMPGLHGYYPSVSSPLSFLVTLNQIDSTKLAWPNHVLQRPASSGETTLYDPTVDRELKEVRLRSDHWELVSATQEEVVYRRFVPRGNLEFKKTYTLKPLSEDEKKTGKSGFGLLLRVEVKNLDSKEHTVSYQLDGPNGLPMEGAWYASGRKTGPGWGGYGIRDLVVRFNGQISDVKANTGRNGIGMDKGPTPEQWQKTPLDYLGVDTQYFQCTVIPQKANPTDVLHSFIVPMRVGDFEKKWPITTNISFRMVSEPRKLEANQSIEHTYQIFAGPKRPDVLENYGLRDTLYYGWFAWFVKPMLWLLHSFHAFTLNYALAIIMLTAAVRLCLYSFSRKQVLNTMKMQALKPEIDAINEKYKDNVEARMKATQALYKKHKFNPAAGCLPLFIQLPILIALYRSLSVDVELYGAPLLTEGIRWCSDLAAPDRLLDWSEFWNWLGLPAFNTGYGMFYLGPYFNILPIITVILFLVQQEIMMPPPTTDQEKSMRTTMKFMMIFMAFMFYKVPSGLCIYFIVSTLWGFGEKRFMPKAIHLTPQEEEEISPHPKKQLKKERKPQKEPTGWRKKWNDLLEEARHKPGDSQKPGKRKK